MLFLSCHPVVNTIMNDVYSVNKTIDDNSKIAFSDEHEEEQVQDFIEKSRSAYKRTLHQSLMMSIAQILPRERDLFVLFPEVITVDCTAYTNIEEKLSLTIAGKDSLGKIFYFFACVFTKRTQLGFSMDIQCRVTQILS